MANKIEKGAVLVVTNTNHGSGSKGDWCFCKTEKNDKITIWAENADFKCETGDKIEILDIKSVSIVTKKYNDKFYNNYNVTALLKNQGSNKTDFDDFGNFEDFENDNEDFV